MKHRTTYFTLAALSAGLVTPALATNGDHLIGIGPISRAMGGTGIAAPQDAISAVFANPAAMCISPSCAAPQADFALTAFMPQVSASITNGGVTTSSKSDDGVFPIPALGVSFPIGGDASRWRAGFSAYGVSGLGVDYRNSAIANTRFSDINGAFPPFPIAAGTFTELAVMKMAPSVAYSISPDLSVGASFHIDYAMLEIDNGTKDDFGFGFQIGLLWKPVKDISVGVTYVNPQKTTFDGVSDFNQDGTFDRLTLESPQQIAAGIAWTGMDDRLLVELNGRWINWEDAEGYSDFQWEDQWVVGIGVQYEAIPEKLFLRAGYNYGNNPVKDHSGWDGAANPMTGMPNEFETVQGVPIPKYYFESFRTVGFPAVVEHHLSLGFGYQINPDLVLNVAWVHAFEADVTSTGTDFTGMPTTIKSELYEDSVDIGLTWRY